MQETDWLPNFDGDRLRLTMAIGEYDHVRDLCTGRVRAHGITVTPLHMATEEIFHRFIRYREWEISEISLAKYAAMRSQGDHSLCAIPVFPSRVFRHSSIYVRRDGRVRAPADLAGCRIGVPEWAQTAAVYTRGLLADSYGIDLRGIAWTQAGVNQPGRAEKVRLALPDGIRLQPRLDASLDALLRAGELDAVLSAHPPASFEAGDPAIVRLFDDPVAEERAYYQATGIFPIMHVVVLRAAVLDRFPWAAMKSFRGVRPRQAPQPGAARGIHRQPGAAALGAGTGGGGASAARARPVPLRPGAEFGHAGRLPRLGAGTRRHPSASAARGAVRQGDAVPRPHLICESSGCGCGVQNGKRLSNPLDQQADALRLILGGGIDNLKPGAAGRVFVQKLHERAGLQIRIDIPK